MAITTKNRSDLKSYFVKNAIPTEQNFADFIDAGLNQADDGVFKIGDDPLSVSAAPGDQKRVLRFYGTYPAQNPDWTISLEPRSVANDASTGRAGFGLDSPDGTNRLFLDQNGKLGLGTTTPSEKLTVQDGDVAIQGGNYRRLKIVSDSYWAGIEIVARQDGTAGHPHIDFTHGDLDSPNFGLRLYAIDNQRMSLIAATAAQTKLGIGINPTEALHVNGNAKISGGITGASLSVGALTTTTSANLTGLTTTGAVTHNDAVTVTGRVSASGGVSVGTGDRNGHINDDGALYRKGSQVWLTVDNNLYLRKSSDGDNWGFHFDVTNKHLELGSIAINQNNRTSHIDGDGIFYRKGGQLWLTVDDNFYIRDSGASGDAKVAYFNTNNGNLWVAGHFYAAGKVHTGGTEIKPYRIESGSTSSSADNLRSGSGDRGQFWDITFSETFSEAPTVVVAFSMLDTENDQNLRVRCWSESVTKTSCRIWVKTWSGSKVYGVTVTWIAYGI